tara:strand:- start:218 stop:874 length:657 start_codon:yes stop_codon:yes gene_type:complete
VSLLYPYFISQSSLSESGVKYSDISVTSVTFYDAGRVGYSCYNIDVEQAVTAESNSTRSQLNNLWWFGAIEDDASNMFIDASVDETMYGELVTNAHFAAPYGCTRHILGVQCKKTCGELPIAGKEWSTNAGILMNPDFVCNDNCHDTCWQDIQPTAAPTSAPTEPCCTCKCELEYDANFANFQTDQASNQLGGSGPSFQTGGMRRLLQIYSPGTGIDT